MIRWNIIKKLKLTILLIATLFVASAQATSNISPEVIDDPDFFAPQSELGSSIKALYEKHASFVANPQENLPADFAPLAEAIKTYIDSNTEQEDARNKFYTGPEGKANGKDFNFEIQNLPTKLVRVAFCFGLDPYIFTGLVKKESAFKKIAHSSGAMGFTQITPPAIMEVNEQLGILGEREATPIFMSFINCYTNPQKQWTHMWDKEKGVIPFGKNAYIKSYTGPGRSMRNAKAVIEWFKEDSDRNLVYGAMTLKIFLARNPGNYLAALNAYNSVYNSYSKQVLKNYSQLSRISGPLDVNSTYYSLKHGNLFCKVPMVEWFSEDALSIPAVFYDETTILNELTEKYYQLGYCQEIEKSI